jgi:hypothetical protein
MVIGVSVMIIPFPVDVFDRLPLILFRVVDARFVGESNSVLLIDSTAGSCSVLLMGSGSGNNEGGIGRL